MQKAIGDAAENKFISVWLDLFTQTLADIQVYYELAYESPELGKIIYDNQLTDIAKLISRDLFLKTYWHIFDEQSKNGTIDAHLYLLYAIFGGNSTITVTHPNPLHTIFHITTDAIDLVRWVTRAGDNMITRAGDFIVFRSVLADMTNAEISSLLQATANYGEFIEFDIETNINKNDYGKINEIVIFREDFGYVTQTTEIIADYGYVTQPAE